MSPIGIEISGKREIISERCVQQESRRKLEVEGVVVALQQEGSFEWVVVTSGYSGIRSGDNDISLK